MADFPKLARPVIIAMKGLPCTGKSDIATCIGQWAKCPTFYIDHFLDALSLEKGYTFESLPSPNEAERLHRLAFDVLCKAASNALQWGVHNIHRGYKCVIVKSHLCYSFELDRLVQLSKECGCGTILIIDFQIKNEYRYRERLETKVALGGQREWYKPRSWKDIDKAKEDHDCLVSQANNYWNLHIDKAKELVGNGGIPRVARLVLDPFDDLYLVPYVNITMSSVASINSLLRRLENGEDLNKEEFLLEGRYVVVKYEELRGYLLKKELEGVCSRESWGDCNTKNGSKTCVFKYWEGLQANADSGVCEQRVVSGQPAYTCYFCTLALHKSCAVLQDGVAFEGTKDINFLRGYPNHCIYKRPCKSCWNISKGALFGQFFQIQQEPATSPLIACHAFSKRI